MIRLCRAPVSASAALEAASVGHGYPQPAHGPGPAGGSPVGGCRGLPAASALVIACRIHHVAYVENR
jgi:hypothetical protein